MKITDEKELRKIANDVRIDIINEVYSAKSGHPGGALSIADILTVLYFNQMNVNPEMPESNLRDRLVLSKGHASAALYAVLAERGFINKEDLKTFRKLGSNLQGHPDMEKVPGVDMSTGSLGQGLSIANGMAIDSFEKARQTKGQPSIIIARTVKGKGVPFMENKAEWHGKAPNDEQYERAMKALKLEEEKIEHNISELPGKEDSICF